MKPLEGKVCVVAGATRGAGRGIAIELGAAGATVYCVGQTTRDCPSPMQRPETIEETAERVTTCGGIGIPVRADCTVRADVEALFAQVDREQEGRLDVLVNDVWGGETMIEWDKPSCLPLTALALTPGYLRSEQMLAFKGVTEATWRDGIKDDAGWACSETPFYIGHAVAALAADPDVRRKSGQALATWHLYQEYGFTHTDQSQPDWGASHTNP